MTIRFTIFIHLPYYRPQHAGNKTFHKPRRPTRSAGVLLRYSNSLPLIGCYTAVALKGRLLIQSSAAAAAALKSTPSELLLGELRGDTSI